jgi:hypothetical protein
MGRPPKGDRARNVQLALRLTEEEMAALRAAADEIGEDLSDLARRGIRREIARARRDTASQLPKPVKRPAKRLTPIG